MPGSNIQVTPQDVRQMGNDCKQQATALGDLIRNVDGKISTVAWKSDAKTKFDRDWADYKTTMAKLQRALDDLGEAARKMARNYEEADAAYKG